ncbi:MAG: acyltransferase [Microthrixaceae bacterium]
MAATDAGRPHAPTSDTGFRRLRRDPRLDGVRGLAILAVLGTHEIFVNPSGPEWFVRGLPRVDLFLVLSGFLIVGTLLSEHDRTGRIDLGGFARRRVRRLVPPLAAFLAIHALVTAVLGDSLGEELRQAMMGLFFVGNWQLSVGHHPPFDLVHLWSLGVEAQLYFVAAFGVLLARRHLRNTSAIVGGLVVAIVAVALWRIGWWRHGTNPEALYERTDLRADSFLMGAVGIVLWRARVVGHRVAERVGWFGLLFLLGAFALTPRFSPALFGGGFTLVAFAAMWLVVGSGSDRSLLGAVVGSAPLRWLGERSYSLYLWHLPVFRWTDRALPDAPPVPKYLLAIVVALVVTELTYRLVERPLLSRRRPGLPEPTPSSASTPPP